MGTQEQDSEQIYIQHTPGLEYQFTTGFIVSKPGTMVYLDFVQRDPADQSNRGVGRVVMLPAVAELLSKQLSELLSHPGENDAR